MSSQPSGSHHFNTWSANEDILLEHKALQFPKNTGETKILHFEMLMQKMLESVGMPVKLLLIIVLSSNSKRKTQPALELILMRPNHENF